MTGYADGYDLYAIDIAYGYDLDRIIAAGVRDDQAYIDAVVAQVLPGVPAHVQAPQFACSAFVAVDAEGRVRTGRNYDFKDDTSALLVRNHPVRAAMPPSALRPSTTWAITLRLTPSPDVPPHSWARLPSSTASTNVACPLPCSPWIPNPVTKTRSAPSSTLRSPSAWCSTGAATTQEAVDLLSAYDMHAMAGRDYHFFINDAAGDAQVVEWDPRDPGRAFKATPVRQVTNFYACYGDEVLPNQKNGELGHGKERAIAIADVLDAHTGAQDEAVVWKALRAAAQEPNPEDITSNTQWSVVFDNTEPAAVITLRRHWGDVDAFAL